MNKGMIISALVGLIALFLMISIASISPKVKTQTRFENYIESIEGKEFIVTIEGKEYKVTVDKEDVAE